MKKQTIGILFGGYGEEHFVSVRSAREVARHLDLGRYTPVYIGITEDGVWRRCVAPTPDWEAEAGAAAILSPDRETHGVLLLEDGRYTPLYLDLVFPVLHGRMGEDGAIQGLLECAGIPYVGCNIQSSAVCMDKSLTYTVAAAAGIATPGFWAVTDDGGSRAYPYPVFVKPARSGSSFGVSRVTQPSELQGAIDAARRYDTKILIEEAVTGSEVGCAVLETEAGLLAGEVDQITVSGGFFKIHQEANPENGPENATITVPADIAPETREAVQETAKALYRALGCRGLSRVDLFLKADGSLVLNEVNTMPGLTAYSRFPAMMAAAGLSVSALVDHAIQFALKGG